MSDTAISRRGFLGHVGGAYLATTLVAGTTLAVTDPMLDCIRTYLAERDRMNSMADITDEELENGFPLYDDLRDKLSFDPPTITTEAGALAALRLATEELKEVFGNAGLPLLESALSFFEARVQSAN